MTESIIIFFLTLSLLQPCSAESEYQYRELFHSMRLVECYPTGPRCDIDPHHKGAYQISKAHWKLSGMQGSWDMVEDEYYAKLTMLAYWRRFNSDAVKNNDFETLARMHNGGIGFDSSTDIYWQRVQIVISGHNWWNGEKIPDDILR